jgi:hypothetical protein
MGLGLDMRRMIGGIAIVIVASLAIATPAFAGLLGTNVNGVMNISGFGAMNFFDPVTGFVPAGSGNSTSPNNVVIGSGIGFGYADGANTDTANFTATGVTLQDVSVSGSRPIVYTFTDTAFSGLSLAEISSNFPGLSFDLSGDVLALSTDSIPSGGTFDATFQVVTPVPEPASLVLLGTALAGLGLLRRRKPRPRNLSA